MPWEFRCFVPFSNLTTATPLFPLLNSIFQPPTQSSQFQAHPILQDLHALPTQDGSRRVDDYLILHHVDPTVCGLKVRGGTCTEVKLRKGCVPHLHSSCEKWNKYAVTGTPRHQAGTGTDGQTKEESSAWCNAVSAFLIDKGVLTLGLEATVAWTVSLDKCRKECRIHNVLVTVDFLRCSVRTSDADNAASDCSGGSGGSGGSGSSNPSMWVSLSLEGSAVQVQTAMQLLKVMDYLNASECSESSESLPTGEKKVQEETASANEVPVIFGGYPTFAHVLTQR